MSLRTNIFGEGGASKEQEPTPFVATGVPVSADGTIGKKEFAELAQVKASDRLAVAAGGVAFLTAEYLQRGHNGIVGILDLVAASAAAYYYTRGHRPAQQGVNGLTVEVQPEKKSKNPLTGVVSTSGPNFQPAERRRLNRVGGRMAATVGAGLLLAESTMGLFAGTDTTAAQTTDAGKNTTLRASAPAVVQSEAPAASAEPTRFDLGNGIICTGKPTKVTISTDAPIKGSPLRAFAAAEADPNANWKRLKAGPLADAFAAMDQLFGEHVPTDTVTMPTTVTIPTGCVFPKADLL